MTIQAQSKSDFEFVVGYYTGVKRAKKRRRQRHVGVYTVGADAIAKIRELTGNGIEWTDIIVEVYPSDDNGDDDIITILGKHIQSALASPADNSGASTVRYLTIDASTGELSLQPDHSTLTDYESVIALTYSVKVTDDNQFVLASANANNVGSVAIDRERARQLAIAKAMQILLG